jgi:molybdate transport system regulatory protein
MAKRRLQAHLQVEAGDGAMIGDDRIRLLEAIDHTGSINKAARKVPMSYKTAWDALDALDNLADQPVIVRTVGGLGGGGTTLTAYGRWLVAMFRAVEGEYQAAVDALADAAGPEVADKAAFQRLLRRLTMSTTVSNQFACRVTTLFSGPVLTKVGLALDADTPIEVHVTTEGAEAMRLAEGQDVIALVKAQSILLIPGAQVRTSAQNHLSGVVSRLKVGPLNTEVIVDVPPRMMRHIKAVVATPTARALGLDVGAPVTAAFQAMSPVLIAFPGDEHGPAAPR